MKKLMVMLLAAGVFAVGSLSPAMRAVRKSEARRSKAKAGAPGATPGRTGIQLQRLRPRRRPAPLHRPTLPKPPNINKGDTAFMYAATMMVILMTIPGLALFYGGLVRSKNMLSVLMQVFVTFALIADSVDDLRLLARVHRRGSFFRRTFEDVFVGCHARVRWSDV